MCSFALHSASFFLSFRLVSLLPHFYFSDTFTLFLSHLSSIRDVSDSQIILITSACMVVGFFLQYIFLKALCPLSHQARLLTHLWCSERVCKVSSDQGTMTTQHLLSSVSHPKEVQNTTQETRENSSIVSSSLPSHACLRTRRTRAMQAQCQVCDTAQFPLLT